MRLGSVPAGPNRLPELDPEQVAGPAPAAPQQRAGTGPEAVLALQQSAGNAAVTRMIQGGAEGAFPSPTGALMKDGEEPLRSVGPGMLLGQGDGAEAGEQTAGPTAEDADAAITGPATAVATAPADTAAAPAAPATDTSTAAPPAAAAPAQPAAPAAAPGSGGAAAPAAAPPLVINHKTDMRAPDGTNDDRTTVAIGEVVYFDVGGVEADWTASAGWPPRRTARKKIAWESSTPGNATITATLADGRSATVDMTIVGVDSLTMRKESEDPEAAGTAGAGMWLIPRFGPRNVNFGNIEWLEVAGPASAVSGFFADLVTAGVDLSHHPNPDFLRIGPGLRDHAAFLGLGTGPFKAGHFHWDIPNRFRRAGTTGTGTMFVTSVQSFDITATGQVTVTKQGASVTRSP